jgi:hypothetical protein
VQRFFVDAPGMARDAVARIEWRYFDDEDGDR